MVTVMHFLTAELGSPSPQADGQRQTGCLRNRVSLPERGGGTALWATAPAPRTRALTTA